MQECNWRTKHLEIIKQFLEYINKKTDNFILKGGTSLLMCYKLDRFSEDIDLDSNDLSFFNYIDEFCKKYNYTYRNAKDTNVVKRCILNYGEDKKLKIEVSYRDLNLNKIDITKINDINVYNINKLCILKSSAYSGRDKLRDLYDLCFIINNYYEELSNDTISIVKSVVEYKGIEQFDYFDKPEYYDELIDMNKLSEDFLKMYNKLGLLSEESQEEENFFNLNKNEISLNDINLLYKYEKNNTETEDEDEDEPNM